MVSFLDALLAYSPSGTYRHGIAVISSEASNPHLGWDKLANSVLTIHVPGEHLSLLKEPFVQQVARNLQSVLDQS